MLNNLRSLVGSLVSKILLGLLVLSFAVWGVSGSVFQTVFSNNIATVGNTKVSIPEYMLIYEQNLSRTSRWAGRRLPRDEAKLWGVEAQTRNQLTGFATLDEYARRNKIALSEDEVLKSIVEDPSFHGADGKFSAQRFEAYTRGTGLLESDIKQLQTGNAVREQIRAALTHGDFLPKVYVDALETYHNEERKFEYINLTPELAGPANMPKDDQLPIFFEENKENYEAPEYRQLALLTLGPKEIADEDTVAEEQIEADYEANIDTYIRKERRAVLQFVMTQEQANKAAEDLAIHGKTFEYVLEDNGLTVQDVDLGLLEKEDVHEDLQEATFGLARNEVSPIIDGPFGPTLIKVTSIRPGRTRSLDDVSDEIRTDIALRQAADQLIEMQIIVEDSLAGGDTLDEAARKAGTELRIIDAVDASGQDIYGNRIDDIPSSYDLLQIAFQKEVGEENDPLDYDIGFVWFEVREIIESRERTFGEVKGKLAQHWIEEYNANIVETRTEEIRMRLEEGEDIGVIAEEIGAEVAETEFLKRDGRDREFGNAVKPGFENGADNVFVVDARDPNTKTIFVVAESRMPEDAESPEDDITSAHEGAGEDMIQQLITKLKDEYGVSFNDQLVDYVLANY